MFHQHFSQHFHWLINEYLILYFSCFIHCFHHHLMLNLMFHYVIFSCFINIFHWLINEFDISEIHFFIQKQLVLINWHDRHDTWHMTTSFFEIKLFYPYIHHFSWNHDKIHELTQILPKFHWFSLIFDNLHHFFINHFFIQKQLVLINWHDRHDTWQFIFP